MDSSEAARLSESFDRFVEAATRSGLVDRMKNAKMTLQRCVVCHRECAIDEVYTGEARQRMCPRCRSEYASLAKVVCRNCGKFLCFMKSGVTPDGYGVRPDETLHVPWCDNCNREMAAARKKAPIEEFERFAAIKRGNEMAGVVDVARHGHGILRT